MTLHPENEAHCLDLLRRNNHIAAVKAVRRETLCDLSTAKEIVSKLKQKLHVNVQKANIIS